MDPSHLDYLQAIFANTEKTAGTPMGDGRTVYAWSLTPEGFTPVDPDIKTKINLTFKSGGLDMECEISCPRSKVPEVEAKLATFLEGLG